MRHPTLTGLTIVVSCAAVLAASGCAHQSPRPQDGARPQTRPFPPSARRELVFRRAILVGEGPTFVLLGGGFVYRLVISPRSASVSLSPRLLYKQPPLFRSPLFGDGGMVLPSFSGEYRIGVTAAPADEGPVGVSIYKEEYDNVEYACFRDPGTEPCRQLRHGRTGRRLGVYLAPMAAVVAYLFMTKD